MPDSECHCPLWEQVGAIDPVGSKRRGMYALLSGTLQVLEADGLVKRTVYPEVPPRVEYQLTEMGHSLMPIIADLTQWALSNMPTIMNHREQYEQSI